MKRKARGFLLPLLLLPACRGEAPLIRVELSALEAGTRLSIIGAPGARINARRKPAFEAQGGAVLTFDSPALTPDSAYFSAVPTVLVPGTSRPQGLVRASVCPAGEAVCLSVVVKLCECGSRDCDEHDARTCTLTGFARARSWSGASRERRLADVVARLLARERLSRQSSNAQVPVPSGSVVTMAAIGMSSSTAGR